MLSFNQVESNHSNKSKVDPCQWRCSWIINFLIVWISDIVKMLLLFFQFEFKMAVATCCMQEGKHVNNIWHILKEELISFWYFFKSYLPF